jgi:hypothetical protein
MLLVLGGSALYLSLPPPDDDRPHPFNQDRNAVWLEHRWLERPHSDAEMVALVSRLDGLGIRYIFPHLIPFDRAGVLPEHDRNQMRRFLGVVRENAPKMKVLPWVGGLRLGTRRTRRGTLDLPDIVQRQRIVAECRGLIDEGFHGVHVNIEPIDDGNVDFLALLRALRTAVGQDHVLSISAIRPAPFSPPMAHNFLWTPGYYERVGAIVDQIVIMAYDTALPNPQLYRRYLAYTAATAARALMRASGDARVLIGVPTYDATGMMHRAEVETPENALRGIVTGLRGLGAGGAFEGIALYAEWTTDESEWDTYNRLWRGQPAQEPTGNTRP